MPKIIKDESVESLIKYPRKKINRIMMLTGGGATQSLFSMGSVKCLVDNGMFYDKKTDKFYFEVISAISGGTILLMFLDLATNPQYSYHKKDDWYNKYVRKQVYAFLTSNLLAKSIKSGFKEFETRIFDLIPEYNEYLVTENTNIECKYNYIDANLQMVSHDHTDVIDLKRNVKVPMWHVIRTMRCTLPFTYFNGKGSYDAGAVSNVPLATALTDYDATDTFIIFANPHLIYDTYPAKSWTELALGALGNIMSGANHSINGLLDLIINHKGVNMICSMPNELYDSKDETYKGIIRDFAGEVSKPVVYYNGVLFYDLDSMRLIENLGYTQMYAQLKAKFPKKKLVFDIPNPEVYEREKAKAIYEKLKTLDPIYETFKTFF
jgi:hypothetical protein